MHSRAYIRWTIRGVSFVSGLGFGLGGIVGLRFGLGLGLWLGLGLGLALSLGYKVKVRVVVVVVMVA